MRRLSLESRFLSIPNLPQTPIIRGVLIAKYVHSASTKLLAICPNQGISYRSSVSAIHNDSQPVSISEWCVLQDLQSFHA